MSSSWFQLALDFFFFAIIHSLIIFPLMRRAIAFIVREAEDTTSTTDFSQAFANTKACMSHCLDDNDKTTNDIKHCDRCDILFEGEQEQSRLVTWQCTCNWCAECIEQSFTALDFEVDTPLRWLAKHCPHAADLTIRKMLPGVRHILSDESREQADRNIMLKDTIDALDLQRLDWMLDVDEE